MQRSANVDDPQVREVVLLIDSAKAQRTKAAAFIRTLGHSVRTAGDAFEAHGLVDGASVVIATHPHAQSIYPRLHAAGIALVLALEPRTARVSHLCEEQDADGFVYRPYNKASLTMALYAAGRARRLRARTQQLEEADQSGKILISTRANQLHVDLFKTLLPLEIRRARRHGYPIAICVVALDPPPGTKQVSFKLAVACEPYVRQAVRNVDLMVRYGAGRFLVLLPHTDGAGAESVGGRITAEVLKCPYRVGPLTLNMTASVGIAALKPGNSLSFARLIRDAQTALKAAQLKGGNRVIVR